MEVIVIGGGWGGCAAALAAVKAGATVTLLERTDMLLGVGLVAGRMGGNGRITALKEAEAMGGMELFDITRQTATHNHIDYFGVEGVYLYNVTTIEPMVRGLLEKAGVSLRLRCRVTDVAMEGDRMRGVVLPQGEIAEAAAFVDATGTAGPQAACSRNGNGCVMCINRCPHYGNRVSIAAKAGVKEGVASRGFNKGIGVMGQALHVIKETVAPEVIRHLEGAGVMVIPLVYESAGKNEQSVDIATALHSDVIKNSVVAVDNGYCKLMYRSFIPLEKLRLLPGFENAVYHDPLCGGEGNSIRFMSVVPRDDSMRVRGVANLFCAGEKQGLIHGVVEAIASGLLAGHNAARMVLGERLLELPRSTAIGEAFAYVNGFVTGENVYVKRFTMESGECFKRIKECGLYTLNDDEIRQRIHKAGVENIFGPPVAFK